MILYTSVYIYLGEAMLSYKKREIKRERKICRGSLINRKIVTAVIATDNAKICINIMEYYLLSLQSYNVSISY